MIRKGLPARFCYCYVCCCSQLKMKVYVFVVVEFCLEIRGGGMYSQAIAYAFVFLPSNRIFVTFSNRVLESDTSILSTAYTHIFSFSLHKSLCSRKAKFFAESHFIRLNTGKEQKRRELALMRIEGNPRHDRLPAQIWYVITIYWTLT